MIKKQPVKSRKVTKVTFELPADIEADAVYLLADARNWEPLPFERLKNGKWRLIEEFDPGSEVQFRYKLVQGDDARYLNDSDADGSVANDQGSENALLKA